MGKSGAHATDDSNTMYSSGKESLLSRYERLQEKVFKMSRSVRLLLLIRSNLLRHNAQIALSLLTDGAYLRYSEEHLYQILLSSKTIN